MGKLLCEVEVLGYGCWFRFSISELLCCAFSFVVGKKVLMCFVEGMIMEMSGTLCFEIEETMGMLGCT